MWAVCRGWTGSPRSFGPWVPAEGSKGVGAALTSGLSGRAPAGFALGRILLAGQPSGQMRLPSVRCFFNMRSMPGSASDDTSVLPASSVLLSFILPCYTLYASLLNGSNL